MTYAPKTWVDGECLTAALLNAMETGIDIAQGDVMKLYGLTGAIPASNPLLVGRLYIESDFLQRWWRDNGIIWEQVQP